MKIKQIVAIAALALLAVSCGKKGGMQMGDNEYPVVTVGTTEASMQSVYPAIIKGIQDVEIRPKVAGFITKVNVKEGQQVSAGQLLFTLDNATYQAAVRQAEAAVNTAKAQLNTAKLTFENNQKLFNQNVIGQFELTAAQNSYQTAQAALAQAQAALASARETLSFCFVKSPAAGFVGTLPFKEGALVSPSSPEALTTVSDISTMEVYFSLPEKDVLALTKQQGSLEAAVKSMPTVKLQLSDGSTYNHPGEVVKMSGVIDASTGSVQFIAHFQNPEKLLKSGGSGNIIVPKIAQSAIIIPMSAVSEVQNKLFVYLVDKDNKARYTEITVEPQNDGKNYIVTSGMKAGDRYVTNGITKLTDGADIQPITPERYQQKIAEQAKAMTASDFVKASKK